MTGFRVGFSGDFLDSGGELVFPDIGLSLLDGVSRLTYEFIRDYRPEYSADQLEEFDVLVSLKPRITRESLRGLERLCAIGRCGVGYDNVDLAACTEHDIAVFITPAGVVKPVAEAIVLLMLALPQSGDERSHGAAGPVGGEHPATRARTARTGSRNDRARQHRARSSPDAEDLCCRAVLSL